MDAAASHRAKFLIAAVAVFGEDIHSGGRPLQILNGRLPLVSGVLLGLDVILTISRLTFPLRCRGCLEGLGPPAMRETTVSSV